MAIPTAVNDAATQYASRHGGGIEIYNAYIEGWQQAQKEKKAAVKETALALDDEYPFETWWNLYDKKKSKDKCMAKWLTMTYDERRKAIERTPLYVAATPDVKFRKDPTTWLNQKCWNDEYVGEKPMQLVEADAGKFMAYFNEHFKYTAIPKLTEMTDTRRQSLNIIYTLHRADILTVLNKVRDSDYLTGENGKRRPVTFEEIFSVDMFVRIKEGYYDE